MSSKGPCLTRQSNSTACSRRALWTRLHCCHLRLTVAQTRRVHSDIVPTTTGTLRGTTEAAPASLGSKGTRGDDTERRTSTPVCTTLKPAAWTHFNFKVQNRNQNATKHLLRSTVHLGNSWPWHSILARAIASASRWRSAC